MKIANVRIFLRYLHVYVFCYFVLLSSSPVLADCNGYVDIELTGSVSRIVGTDTFVGTATNTSNTGCVYDIGMTSYRVTQGDFWNQQLFDSQLATLQPGQTLQLSVEIPPCGLYQVDLFHRHPEAPYQGCHGYYQQGDPSTDSDNSLDESVITDQGVILNFLAGTCRYSGRIMWPAGAHNDINGVACPVPTPTPIPTPTPTPTPIPLTCDLGATASLSQLNCEAERTTVTVDGSRSQIHQDSSFLWSSDCPNSVIADPTILVTNIEFDSSVNLQSVSCSATLTVSRKTTGESRSCSATLGVAPCPRDCAGLIRGGSVIDRCGVCQGGGDTCPLNCSSTDIREAQLQLDGGAFGLNTLAKRAAKNLSRSSKRQRAFARKSIATAKALYLAAWTNVYSIPSLIVSCESSAQCISSSIAPTKGKYHSNFIGLVKLIATIQRRVQRTDRDAQKVVAKINRSVKVLVNKEQKNLARIPDSMLQCGG